MSRLHYLREPEARCISALQQVLHNRINQRICFIQHHFSPIRKENIREQTFKVKEPEGENADKEKFLKKSHCINVNR